MADQELEQRLGFLGQRARAIRDAFARHGVEYMFIGKGAAVAQGLNATTKDLDVYPSASPQNRKALVAALLDLGFPMQAKLGDVMVDYEQQILSAKDFIQFLEPFDLDIVFAPDGFESYEEAARMKVVMGGYPFLSLDGIIQSKQATGRARDKQDIPALLELKRWKEEEWRDG